MPAPLATAVARPMVSYRALDIGMPPETLGLVATSFAIAPVINARLSGASHCVSSASASAAASM